MKENQSMIINRSGTLTSLPLLFVLFTGCAAGEEGEDAEPMTPITSIALASGSTMEFYEPSPGVLLVSEVGRVGIPPLPSAKLRPVDLYRRLAPGQPVPEVLVAAQARADARRTEPALPADEVPELPAPQVAGGVLNWIDNQSCDDHWFNDTFCAGSPDWEMCLVNHWNGAYAGLSSVDWVRHAVCADIGDVTLKVRMGDGTGGLWDVLEGHYRSFVWSDPCVFGCNESTRGDVVNASGNRFHYAVQANY